MRERIRGFSGEMAEMQRKAKRDMENKEALKRVNLMLSRGDSEWLNAVATEIQQNTGATISRSEIVRAALATMAELHGLATRFPGQFMPLRCCKTGEELAVSGILAVRRAVMPQP